MKLPQLALRELFVWLTVVALLCAWWFQEGKVAEARRQLVESERRLKEAERIAKGLEGIVNAYRSDGRLHDVGRPDGSVYITDEPIGPGFGRAGE